MLCPNCQRELPAIASFCNFCGTQVSDTAPDWSGIGSTPVEQIRETNAPSLLPTNQPLLTPGGMGKPMGRIQSTPPPDALQRLLLRLLKPELAGNAFIGILSGSLIPFILGLPACWLLLTLAHSIAPTTVQTTSGLNMASSINLALGISSVNNIMKDTLQLFMIIQGTSIQIQQVAGSQVATTEILASPLNGLLTIPALCLCLGGYYAACTDLTNQTGRSLLRGAAIALPYTLILLLLSGQAAGDIFSVGGVTQRLAIDTGSLLIFGLLWGIFFGLLGASFKLARGQWRHMMRQSIRTRVHPRIAGTIIGSFYASGLGIGLSFLTVCGLLAFSTFSNLWLANNLCIPGNWQILTTWGIAQGPLYAVNLFFFSFGTRIVITNPDTTGGGCFYNGLPATELTLRNQNLHLALWVYALLLIPTFLSLFIGGRISTAIAGPKSKGMNTLNGALMAIPFTLIMLLLSILCTITQTTLLPGSNSFIPETQIQSAGVAAPDLILWALLCGTISGGLGGLYEGSQARTGGKKVLTILFFLPEMVSKPLSFMADRLCNVPSGTQRSQPRALLYSALFVSLLLAIICITTGWFFIAANQSISVQLIQLINDSMTAALIILPGLLIFSACATALLRDPIEDGQRHPPII